VTQSLLFNPDQYLAPPGFDLPEQVEAARKAGIDAAEEHADPEWKTAARSALLQVAAEGGPFTADHVWLVLDRQNVSMPRTPAALGPIFLGAAKGGLIRKTGRFVRTRFARRHRDLVEWEAA